MSALSIVSGIAVAVAWSLTAALWADLRRLRRRLRSRRTAPRPLYGLSELQIDASFSIAMEEINRRVVQAFSVPHDLLVDATPRAAPSPPGTESDDAYRARIIARIRYTAFGEGLDSAYTEFARILGGASLDVMGELYGLRRGGADPVSPARTENFVVVDVRRRATHSEVTFQRYDGAASRLTLLTDRRFVLGEIVPHDVVWDAHRRGMTTNSFGVSLNQVWRAHYTAGIADEASRRSVDLLRAWLTPEQRARYDRHGWFDVVGGTTGRRYRINPPAPYSISELDGSGAVIDALCAVPDVVGLPDGDVMLAQKIALEKDEVATLKMANRHSRHVTEVSGFFGGVHAQIFTASGGGGAGGRFRRILFDDLGI